MLTALPTAGVLLVASPAQAHSSLVSSDPTSGARLASGPSKVTLTFDEPVGDLSQIIVIGPGGTRWESGTTSVLDADVTRTLRPLGPAGTYQIAYRVVSADGHPVSGEVPFTVTAAGTGTPAPSTTGPGAASTPAATTTTTSAGAGGGPVVAVVIGVVVVVGALAAAGLGLARRRR